MKISQKQSEVLIFLANNGPSSIDEIYKNVSFGYYCNQNANIGKFLARMVKRGFIRRLKPGWFEINYIVRSIPDAASEVPSN